MMLFIKITFMFVNNFTNNRVSYPKYFLGIELIILGLGFKIC